MQLTCIQSIFKPAIVIYDFIMDDNLFRPFQFNKLDANFFKNKLGRLWGKNNKMY